MFINSFLYPKSFSFCFYNLEGRGSSQNQGFYLVSSLRKTEHLIFISCAGPTNPYLQKSVIYVVRNFHFGLVLWLGVMKFYCWSVGRILGVCFLPQWKTCCLFSLEVLEEEKMLRYFGSECTFLFGGDMN